ncbi:MAG: type III-B CRISPR module-associated protein Cmr5 [Gammaproteobacteria bacterium]
MSTEELKKSLDQQRAEHALHAVDALRDKDTGHYVSYVSALPATILQNGLGQALAMLLSAAKGEPDEPHNKLYEQMQAWLCGDHLNAPYAGNQNLIRAITEGSEQAYLHAHAEALAYLVWLKKFAVAFLKIPEGRDAR